MNYHVVEYHYYLMCLHERVDDMEAAFERLKIMAKEISYGQS